MPTVGRGCYAGGFIDGDVSVGALLFERTLVFFDITFLGSIVDALLTLFPKTGLDHLFSANLLW